MFRKTAYPSISHKKIKLLKNFPDFDVRTEVVPYDAGVVKLFYGGWISPNRNIDHYFDLGVALKERGFRVELTLCGWGNESYLKSLENISADYKLGYKYLGQLSHKDSVILLQKSDVSIAYYNPDKIINILAASNKIPEIIGSNTILITNEQTEIAKRLAPLDVSLQFNDSILEVIDSLVQLLTDKAALEGFLRRASDFYAEEYAPSKLQIAMDEIFGAVLVEDLP